MCFFILNSLATTESSIVNKFTKSDIGFFLFFCFFHKYSVPIHVLSRRSIFLHNFEGKLFCIRLCVSDWMGCKNLRNLMKFFTTTVFWFSSQTGFDQKFVDNE